MRNDSTINRRERHGIDEEEDAMTADADAEAAAAAGEVWFIIIHPLSRS